MGLTRKILEKFNRKISRLVLVPSDGGRFEVSLNGKLVYSKLQTGSFPEEKSVLKDLEAKA